MLVGVLYIPCATLHHAADKNKVHHPSWSAGKRQEQSFTKPPYRILPQSRPTNCRSIIDRCEIGMTLNLYRLLLQTLPPSIHSIDFYIESLKFHGIITPSPHYEIIIISFRLFKLKSSQQPPCLSPKTSP